LNIQNNYKQAIDEMLEELSKKIPDEHLKEPVEAYIAGGAAVHLLTEVRVSDDLDIALSHALQIPNDLSVLWFDDEGYVQTLTFDNNYNQTLGIMHHDYVDRLIPYKNIEDKFKIYVLSPIDLIISKISRFNDKDREDIKSLIEKSNIHKDELRLLASMAINECAACRPETLMVHLDLILEMFEDGV
jgi:hypothetical protein